MGDDSPIPPVPTVRSTMKSISAIRSLRGRILVRKNMICRSINDEAGVLDAIGITSGHSTKVWMLPVDTIVTCIVETKHNVSLNALAVVDEEVGDCGAVGDEVGSDSWSGNHVLAIGHGTSAIASDGVVAGCAIEVAAFFLG